jgi:hypothetical protein
VSAEGGFRVRALWALAAVAAVSMLVAGALALDPPAERGNPVIPDSTSVAATGHRALLQLLRGLDLPVRAGAGAWRGKGVLVVLEPDLGSSTSGAQLAQLLHSADRALVLLPKWTGHADPAHPGWLDEVELAPAPHVEQVLLALGLDGHLRRRPASALIGGPLGAGKAELETPQLIAGSSLVALLGDDGGLIAGERQTESASGASEKTSHEKGSSERGSKEKGSKEKGSGAAGSGEKAKKFRKLILVTDPDLFSNQGLHRGDNARLALALLERLRGGLERDAPIVLEEGLLRPRSRALFGGLLRFPTVLGVLHLLLLAAAAVWAGTRRFGAPVPERQEGPQGAEALIEGAVALQRLSGRAAHAVAALLAGAVQEVGQRLHAPAALDGAALDGWLDRRAAARGLEARVEALRRSVSEASSARELLAAARAVQRWREGMTDGSG